MSLVGAWGGGRVEALHQYQNDHFHLRHQSNLKGDIDRQRKAEILLVFSLG